KQPVLSFHKDAAGKTNWDLPPPNAKVQVSQFSLVNGTVSYQDLQAKQSIEVTNVGASLAQHGAALEGKVTGTTVWHNEPVNLDLDLSDLNAFAAGNTVNVSANVSAKEVTGKIEGTATLANKGYMHGNFTANTSSVAELARWLGAAPPKNVKVGSATLAG